MRKIALLAALTLLPACSTLDKYNAYQQSLLGPVPLAGVTADPRAAAALDAPVQMYYDALKAAQTDRSKIPEFVDIAIAASDSRCLQWLGRISDTQRQFALTGKNVAVAEGAATAALGLAKASSTLIAGLGIAETAFAGFGDNFNTALLTAPSNHQARVAVLGILTAAATDLRGRAPGMTFAQAYGAVERYAANCSFETISAVVNNSLANTVTTVQPSGALMTQPVTSTFQKDDSGERIIAWWAPGNTINEANEARLLAWLKAHGIGTSITFFASTKLYEAARKQAVSDLQIPGVSP